MTILRTKLDPGKTIEPIKVTKVEAIDIAKEYYYSAHVLGLAQPVHKKLQSTYPISEHLGLVYTDALVTLLG